MTVNLNTEGYEALRERTPVIEWYAELQKTGGTAVRARYPLVSNRTSSANTTPMTFSLTVTGSEVTLPCLIEKVRLYEASTGGDPLCDAETISPLLLAIAGDEGTVVLTITLPAVS